MAEYLYSCSCSGRRKIILNRDLNILLNRHDLNSLLIIGLNHVRKCYLKLSGRLTNIADHIISDLSRLLALGTVVSI